MSTTENTGYIIGTSRTGTIHRAGTNYQADCMFGSWNRGKVGNLMTVATGTVPTGLLCQKCFPEKGGN